MERRGRKGWELRRECGEYELIVVTLTMDFSPPLFPPLSPSSPSLSTQVMIRCGADEQ